MVFSSLTFLYLFLPLTLFLYFVLPSKVRNILLLLASLFFYFYGEQWYLFLMVGEILLAYGAGLLLDNEKTGKSGKKMILILFLTFSLGLLAFFKYANLFTGTVNAVAGKELIGSLAVSMPIGISFYTFQAISYVLDVHAGKYPAEKNILRLGTYVSLFPQLIAGPIVRYGDVAKELREKRKFSFARFSEGAFRFTIGLGKKVLLADRLYAFCQPASAANGPSAVLAWAEGLAFLLYVYFDFSGYSDMAIGLGNCFGFNIPENFSYPLISRSVREFWRRWHISLGTWFRDYLYIPLGGNRKGLPAQIRNLLIVWALTGLWHGASWNYVLWGLGFGIVLILETVWEKKKKRKREDDREDDARKGSRTETWGWKDVPCCLFVLVLTVFLFVWFRFQDWSEAAAQVGKMFGSVPFWSAETGYYLRGAAVLLPASLLGATPLPKRLFFRLEQTKAGKIGMPFARAVWMILLLGMTTAYLVDGSFSPFLYFRF